jgi:septum formation protein
MMKIVLASASPRRKSLLEWAELDFDILVRETDETFPPGLSPQEAAIHVARGKAIATRELDLYKRYESHIPVLAADTMVVLNGEIIGKPVDREDAIKILTRLAGNTHLVVTGVVILHDKKEISFADTTEVVFHPISDADICYYVDKYKPYDKAGAYAIQEWIGVVGIKSINGDFYNVMGLPVSRIVSALAENF